MRYSKLGYWGFTAASVALFAIGVALILWMMPTGQSLEIGVFLSLISVIAIGVALLAYRSADEIVLYTHKSAWFWGCVAAFCTIPPVMVAVEWKLIAVSEMIPFSHQDPSDYFADGVMIVPLLQFACFLVFWAWYNLRRRGQ